MRRILLDENLPHKLRHLLRGHDVRTVAYQGWAGLSNGELLRAVEEAGFEVMITADHGIRYQQNRKNSSVGLIVLSDNDEIVLKTNVEFILEAIDAAEPVGLIWVDFERPDV